MRAHRCPFCDSEVPPDSAPKHRQASIHHNTADRSKSEKKKTTQICTRKLHPENTKQFSETREKKCKITGFPA